MTDLPGNSKTEDSTHQGFQALIEKIPTRSPAEALRFCRGLTEFLASHHPQGEVAFSPAKLSPQLEISVVIPVFNEEDNLPILYKRLKTVLAKVEGDFELVFVNDGSKDRSMEILQRISRADPSVTVVDLARNFGHQVAISAGLDYASGQGVIIMDADLQDPPEVLPEFIRKWREGHDVVYAIRNKRKESFLKRNAYALFYRLLQHVANIDIPLDAGDFCIMDRKVVDLLIRIPERNRFVRGIRSWVGLDQVGLPYERHERFAGQPKYTFTRLVYLALDGLVSFSFLPLRLISMLGLIVSILSIVMAVFYTIKRLTIGLSPPGFATTIVAILFLAGMQLITIGVIGEYVGRIFEEVKHRPLYIVRQLWRKGS